MIFDHQAAFAATAASLARLAIAASVQACDAWLAALDRALAPAAPSPQTAPAAMSGAERTRRYRERRRQEPVGIPAFLPARADRPFSGERS